jgi:hypothetical protein
MDEEWVENMDRVIKGYARTVTLGTVSILSEDVDGMTYVGRWIRTDMLEKINKQAEQNGEEL